MSKNTISIKAESFPWHLKLIGALFLIGAFAAMASYWWLSIILLTIGLILLTGHSGTEIDYGNKTFREYNSYLFIRFGKRERYEGIEKIFINNGQVAKHTSHPSRLYFFNVIVYNAYLKFADGRKIFLTSRSDKDRLIKLLSPLTTSLSVALADNTVSTQVS